jgi:hypothetical protein
VSGNAEHLEEQTRATRPDAAEGAGGTHVLARPTPTTSSAFGGSCRSMMSPAIAAPAYLRASTT